LFDEIFLLQLITCRSLRELTSGHCIDFPVDVILWSLLRYCRPLFILSIGLLSPSVKRSMVINESITVPFDIFDSCFSGMINKRRSYHTSIPCIVSSFSSTLADNDSQNHVRSRRRFDGYEVVSNRLSLRCISALARFLPRPSPTAISIFCKLF
jgi:hypothetical protein